MKLFALRHVLRSLPVALLGLALWASAAPAADIDVEDLQQAMTQAIADVAPSVVQIVVPEMTRRQIEEAKELDRQRRLKALEEEEARRKAEEPVPADTDQPAEPETPTEPEKPAADADDAPKDESKPDESESAPDDSPKADDDKRDKKDDTKTAVRTGLIVSSDGCVITSLVNLGRQTQGIRVRLADGRELPAVRLGDDLRRDIVLLKIEATGLPVPRTAPRSRLAVGQWVVALGRTLLLDQPTASKGIISALDRMAGLAVQTDANVSQMNYGGPLVDLDGRVVAVIASLGRSGSTADAGQFSDSGIGFAVPMEDILAELPELRAGDHIDVPFLGVEFNLMRIGKGAEIRRVLATTAATEAGLKDGDIIVRINDVEIDSPFQLLHQIGSHKVGESLTLKVNRNGKTLTVKATLKPRPEHLRR